MPNILRLSAALIIVASVTEMSAGAPPKLVTTVKSAVTGEPLVLDVTLINASDRPLTYGSAGPSDFPRAGLFKVTVLTAGGPQRELRPVNGQYEDWLFGGCRSIKVGQTVTVPMAIAPLQSGRYTITVESPEDNFYVDPGTKQIGWPAIPPSPPVDFEVKDDDAARKAFEADLCKRVEAGEPFATKMVTAYHIQSVIDALVQNLASDDAGTVNTAAAVLRLVQPLPPETDKAVAAAILRRMNQPSSKEYGGGPNDLASLSI